ncbi:MAG: type II secretion system F family protein [Phycisphaerales bacterium]|nr:type II secretion system F family protein [Phycisphaerales bacterium]
MTLASTQDLLYILLPLFGSMLLCYGIYQVISESKVAGQKKVQERLRGVSALKKNEKEKASILRRQAGGDAKSIADQLLGKLSIVARVQGLLDQADVDWSASKMLMNLVLGAIGVMMGLLAFQASPLAAVGCAGAVLMLPLVALSFKRKRRLKQITHQLPDVFEMMSQALRAGHSLASAIQLVHEQMPNPIASEFGRVYHEQNLGMKIEEALVAMANRLDLLDVKFFVTAVLIQRQTGGDLAEVIDNIGGVIRARIELFGMVAGLTAEGRLSGWVLFALPFLVFAGCMYLNPKYANVLLEDPTGKILLMVAGGMQLMGLAMIRWIVNIKV